MASLLFEGIVDRSRVVLKDEMSLKESGLERHKVIVRLAALLHDIGHAPFSHASENLFPNNEDIKVPYKHEDYSATIIKQHFRDVIENHPQNNNYGITADQVAGLIEGNPEIGSALFWRDIISGQMDADRMDYLVRDSYHAGVDYGRFDWRRLVNTVVAIPSGGEESNRSIGVSEGGWHTAEGLIVARYFMFTQVYFHKTRVAYDRHLLHALEEMLLPEGKFPPPTEKDIAEYLKWDDALVLGMLADGKGGEHGRRLLERDHYRCVIETPETPKENDLEKLSKWREVLGGILASQEFADKSWYGIEYDIPILSEAEYPKVELLSKFSSFVAKMEPIKQVKLYVRKENREEAQRLLNKMEGY